MPWTVEDVDSHKKGLTPKQKRTWVHIANNALSSCLDEGKSQTFCEGRAIRMASGSVDKEMPSDHLALVVEAAIAKSDDEQRRIWGYASIAVRKDGTQLVDLQGDAIDIEDLEEAWYAYVRESGELNFAHDGPVRGHMIEAMVFTPAKLDALGLPPGSLPLGAWVGYEVDDPADYALLKQRGYMMFSIEGTGLREPFDAD
jgi:Putative phage serine protease XkdF